MNLPVVFCAVNKHVFPQKAEDLLKNSVTLIRSEKRLSDKELAEKIGDAVGLINLFNTIDKKLLSAAPRLKVACNVSAGYDDFDLPEMKKRGVVGLNAPGGTLNHSVADLIIGLMIAASRRLCDLDRRLRAGEWPTMSFRERYGLEVSGKKLGIIGMGRIGEVLAAKAISAFDMKVAYSNRNRKPECEARLPAVYKDLETLLADSDFIVVMTPLTSDTRRMIGANEFKLMKKTAVFVNAARGRVVNQEDLIAALRDNEIWAAGLDVFEKEPFGSENRLTNLPNTVLAPHIGSLTAECRLDMAMTAARGLADFFNGQTPANLVREFF